MTGNYRYINAATSAKRLDVTVDNIYRNLAPQLGEIVVRVTDGGYCKRLYREDLVESVRRQRAEDKARRQALKYERQRRKAERVALRAARKASK